MIPAKGCVKNYHWGRVGDDNYIARFQAVAPKSPIKTTSVSSLTSNGKAKPTENKLPLAELWFGSHPSGPATLAIGDHLVKLNEFLSKEPEMAGVINHYFKYNKQLPFLLKILSVAQPLSLQAHPDKKLAQALHKSDPKNYPDSNHKPELAIALTEFEVLCDFRPHEEIAHFMKSLAPLQRIIGDKNCQQYVSLVQPRGQGNNVKTQAALAQCFKSLMQSSKEDIVRETKSLLSNNRDSIGRELSTLISSLVDLYPGDPGVLAPFFLNYIKLAPGQAVYLKANKLHAYIKGECIECMACSDNVVRAGLTTKFRDVQTLINMLDYDAVSDPQDLILPALNVTNENVTIASYAPTEEFKVDRIVISPVDSSSKEFSLPAVLSGSFVIVLNGKAKARDFFDLKNVHKLGFGSAGFVPPKISLNLYDIQGTLVLYRAYC